ncbi:uncharacterized protein LOC143918975 [Arctopsyche grandis]|uniref:uncharacterized protein LOC143918975 n=1 Tax=Arctopsyche grandis TaxID=121162 RepID=UPI00406D6E6E
MAAFVRCTEAINLREPQLSASPLDGANLTMSPVPQSNSAIKLPRLELPTFEGNVQNWPLFSQRFLAAMAGESSQIARFQYLLGSLKGEPQRLVDGLELASDSFTSAWSILDQRYNNKKIVVQYHLQALLEAEPVVSNNHVSLRRLIDDANMHVRALVNLGVRVETWNEILVMFITRKLDRSTLLQWELQTPKYEDCTFSKIMHFLTCQCQSMANADFVLKGESNPRPRTITNPKAAVLHVRRERPSCISCSGSHSLLACPSLRQMSGDERRSNAIKRRLCLNCLRPGHIVHACQTKQRCFKCGHAHHTMLHDSTPYQTSPSNKAKHYRSPKKSENAKPVKSSLVLHSVRRVSPSHARTVLLSTVEVQVRGGDGRSHKVRALLDNGSELNLISEDLRRRLALKSKRMDVNLVGIGSNRTSITSGAVIRILPRIPNQGSSVDLDCAIMPEIANQLPSRNVSEIRSHLPLHLPLADPSFDIPGTVDMVIGSDAYHAMLRNGKRTILVPSKSRGDRGGRIAMMNTAFGWILGGSLEAPTVSSDSRNCHHTTGRDPLSCFGARRPVKTVTRPLDESRISAVRRFRLPKRNVPAPFNPHIFRPSQPSSHNSWPVPSWRTTSCATAGGSGRSARSEGATTPAHAAAAPGRQGHRSRSYYSSISNTKRAVRRVARLPVEQHSVNLCNGVANVHNVPH